MKNVLRKTFGIFAVIGGFVFAAFALIGGLIAKGVWFLICAIEGNV